MKNNNFNMQIGKETGFDLHKDSRVPNEFNFDRDAPRFIGLGSGVGMSGTHNNVDYRGIVGTQGLGKCD
jgi:hypothetical protein